MRAHTEFYHFPRNSGNAAALVIADVVAIAAALAPNPTGSAAAEGACKVTGHTAAQLERDSTGGLTAPLEQGDKVVDFPPPQVPEAVEAVHVVVDAGDGVCKFVSEVVHDGARGGDGVLGDAPVECELHKLPLERRPGGVVLLLLGAALPGTAGVRVVQNSIREAGPCTHPLFGLT